MSDGNTAVTSNSDGMVVGYYKKLTTVEKVVVGGLIAGIIAYTIYYMWPSKLEDNVKEPVQELVIMRRTGNEFGHILETTDLDNMSNADAAFSSLNDPGQEQEHRERVTSLSGQQRRKITGVNGNVMVDLTNPKDHYREFFRPHEWQGRDNLQSFEQLTPEEQLARGMPVTRRADAYNESTSPMDLSGTHIDTRALY